MAENFKGIQGGESDRVQRKRRRKQRLAEGRRNEKKRKEAKRARNKSSGLRRGLLG